MQILNGSITHMAEGSNVTLCPARLVEGQRMAVAFEGTAVVSTFGYSYVLTHRDVGCEDSVNVVLVDSIIHHNGEPVPIAGITNIPWWHSC